VAAVKDRLWQQQRGAQFAVETLKLGDASADIGGKEPLAFGLARAGRVVAKNLAPWSLHS